MAKHSIFIKILGRPLASKERKKQTLSVATGLPALGLDSFASTAYGPEAALAILIPLGVAGLHYFLTITLVIVFVLFMLYLSYMQTIGAFPRSAGAYVVAGNTLGKNAGLWAAIALLIDYLLNVAVGISAGVGAIVSAIPALYPHTLLLCLFVLIMLTLVNLRGIHEPGLLFLGPVILFIVCMATILILGLFYTWQAGGHPLPLENPPPFPSAHKNLSMWLLLSAFANGLTAMTGIEAVSNAVPVFKKPTLLNARWTLTLIAGVLGLFLLGIGYLTPTYHLVAMDENKMGYQMILSQLVMVIAGKGVFYYIVMSILFIILAYSAQTSFIAFPRVCRLLAEDNYLPPFFAEQGRRLVFSHGIILLAFFAAILLITFNGITTKLIPLFAIGAFTAFLFSQSGMVIYWRGKKEANAKLKLLCNALGALTTFIALIVIIIAKFSQGAWIVMVLTPLIFLLLLNINRHYKKIACEIKKPFKVKAKKLQTPIVIIPIQGYDLLAKKAIQFGLLLSDKIICTHVTTELDNEKLRLTEIWKEKVEIPAKEAGVAIPQLKIIHSPYRKINKPILKFIKQIRSKHKHRLITIVIPYLAEPHWYESLLHNIHAASLRAYFFLERDDKTVIITLPWYLNEE